MDPFQAVLPIPLGLSWYETKQQVPIFHPLTYTANYHHLLNHCQNDAIDGTNHLKGHLYEVRISDL
jgi:hypothetical protein